MDNKQILNFEAETKQILDLMIHSIYTHKEIFLRELISNASDALDKARFESLTKSDKYKNVDDLKIKISIDKNNKTITISDNGIGMTVEEVKQNLGSIAKSGTKAFIEKMKTEKNNTTDMDLIGQFGVGFYSSFMVASNVVVETRSVESDKGVRFTSNGDGTYSIEEINRPIEKRGTDITLTIKEEPKKDDDTSAAENYLDEYTIEKLVQKYSNYVRYPIIMSMPKIEEGKEGFEEKTLNSMKSIWQKNKNEVKKEEYEEFYKNEFHDWESPFEVIHTKAEGTIEYTALLFLPSKQPMNFFMPDSGEFGLELYCKNVFIMGKCKELLPEYLKFVKGLVDSQDFSLNISREILQHTGELKKISLNIEKKILDTLATIMKNERERYESFWAEFGEPLKMGAYGSSSNKEKLASLLLYKSSASDKYTSLAEYKTRMKEGQDAIYFATGKDIPSIERLPHLEGIREKGYEVLYFTDRVDEFVANILKEFEGTEIRSVLQQSSSASDNKDNADKKEDNNTDNKIKEVLTAIKNVLGDKVHDVEESNVLKDSAVCFVSRKDGPTINMAKILTESGQNMFGLKAMRILEVNTKHKIFEKMAKEFETNKDSDTFKEYSELLFDQACILESLPLEDSLLFAKRMSNLMVK